MQGTYVPKPKQTVEEYLWEWLPSRRHQIRPNSYRHYESTIRNLIAPYIGMLPAATLSAGDVEALLNTLADKGYGHGSVIGVLRTLSKAYNDGIRKRFQLHNPVNGVQMLSMKPNISRAVPAEDLAKLYQTASEVPYDLARLMIGAGDSQTQLRNLIYSTQYGQTKFTIDVPDREEVMSAIREGHELPPLDLDQSSEVIWERFNDIRNIFPEELTGDVLPFFVDWLLNRVVLVDIGTTDKDMALEIFESMNDRGLQLSNMDMLKSYLLSRISYPDEIERANHIWRDTTQALKSFDKNGDSDFMKSMLRAKYAETMRDTKKSAGAKDFEEIATTFHKWTRDKAELIGLVAPSDFLKFVEVDLTYFAKRYQELLEASQDLKQGLEYVYFNAHNDFTLQYMVILAGVRVGDSDEVFARKANLVAAYIDIMITRRMAEYKNFGYSPMYRPMFALAKDLRNKSLDEIRLILKSKTAELNESLESLKRLRLTKTNKPEIYYILARLTSWLGDETSALYLERNRKDPFEVEHIWANKFERHTDEFTNEFEFAEQRNSLGDLLLLPKSFNASYGALEFSVKVDHYFSQNPLAKSLNEKNYGNNPNFVRKMKDYNLPFQAYGPEEFKRSAIDERQTLYAAMAEIIWSPGILDSI